MIFFLLRHIVSSPADEEPEEDVSVEQLEEKAIGGDARAQTRVSESTCRHAQTGSWHCFQSCKLTQSGFQHVPILGHLEDDPTISV